MATLDRPRIEYRTPVDLVSEVQQGALRIPEFQRGFKWTSSDVISLFDSILRGFPIGNLLFWRRPAPAATVRIGPVQIEAPALSAADWVVDGQQRVTSLLGALTVAEQTSDPRFRIYLDLDESRFHSLGARQQAPAQWLPVSRLVSTPGLLAWMRANAGWMTELHIALADAAAQAVREYQVPTYVVTSDDEAVLRQIFDRLNSTGKPLNKAEVFNALHSGLSDDNPADLPSIGRVAGQMGFGAFDDRLSLRCVLASRGGDIFREDFRDEFLSAEDRRETFRETATCVRDVVDLLRGEVGIVHSRLVPYSHVIPVLTRFVRLHGTPNRRVARLLRRWVWRDAVAGVNARGVNGSAVRRAVLATAAADPYEAAGRLLALTPREAVFRPDLARVHLNQAAAKLNLLGLLSVGPRDLVSGRTVDLAAAFDSDDPVRYIVPATTAVPGAGSFANRVVTGSPSHRAVRTLLLEAPADVSASHVIGPEALVLLKTGDAETFFARRTEALAGVISRHVDAMAEWGARDGRSMADIMHSAA